MVEIPVEKKSGGGILWWVLGALAVAALIWLLAGDGDDATVVDSAPHADTASANENYASIDRDSDTTVATTSGVDSGAVTDVLVVLVATDRTPFVGRTATLSDVTVGKVISDRAFTVGAGDGKGELFVMLDDKLDKGAADARLKIREGMRLAVSGVLDRPPVPDSVTERHGGLTDQEKDVLGKNELYLHALTVREL